MLKSLQEFKQILDDIYGLFLDSTQGFYNNVERLKKAQEQSAAQLNIAIEKADNSSLTYGSGHPDDPSSIQLHVATIREIKERNKKNGKNTSVIGNLCLCQIFNYWEDHYRESIAGDFGLKKNDLKSDIFGDLRHYRQSIIHKKGIAIKEVEKAKILKWYSYNEEINIDNEKFKFIFFNVLSYLNSLDR